MPEQELTSSPEPTQLLLSVVVWFDAYHDSAMVHVQDAKDLHRRGLLLVSSGFLVDDDSDSILLVKEWVPAHDLVRYSQRIRKCDIVNIYQAEIELVGSNDGVVLAPVPRNRNGQKREVYGTVMEYADRRRHLEL